MRRGVPRRKSMCSTVPMKRRLIFGAFGALSLAGAGRALAQPAMPVVGVLVNGSPESFQPPLEDALRRLGQEPGRSIRYANRSSEGDAPSCLRFRVSWYGHGSMSW